MVKADVWEHFRIEGIDTFKILHESRAELFSGHLRCAEIDLAVYLAGAFGVIMALEDAACGMIKEYEFAHAAAHRLEPHGLVATAAPVTPVTVTERRFALDVLVGEGDILLFGNDLSELCGWHVPAEPELLKQRVGGENCAGGINPVVKLKDLVLVFFAALSAEGIHEAR